MLCSIYLGTSELFIYKCLTSRHRLGFSRLLSRLLFFSCRVIYARPGCTVVGVARENAGEDQSAKEGSREDELSRCPSNEPLPLQRNRCYEKGETCDVRK